MSQTAVQVVGVGGARVVGHAHVGCVVSGCVGAVGRVVDIPLQSGALAVPAHGPDAYAVEVHHQPVAYVAVVGLALGVQSAGCQLAVYTEHAAVVGSVVGAGRHVGVVAAAHQLVVDDDGVGEVEGGGAGSDHAAHVAAAEDRSEH